MAKPKFELYEKVRIRVEFPKLAEYENEIVLERWIPWEQVYGPDEEAAAEEGAEGALPPPARHRVPRSTDLPRHWLRTSQIVPRCLPYRNYHI